MQREVFHFQLADQVIDFTFQLIGKQYGRLCAPASVACRTSFLDINVNNRANPLSGNLHQPKLTQRQNVVFCSVVGQIFPHTVENLLAIFTFVHINEVHHNNASHIPQSQLPGYFIGCSQIYFHGIDFLSASGFRPVSAVDINHMHGFCVFNNQIGSASE